jgi:hypothetical protein
MPNVHTFETSTRQDISEQERPEVSKPHHHLEGGGASSLTGGMSDQTTQRIRELFTDYSKLGAAQHRLDSTGARSHTMDFHEFLACMKHIGVLGKVPPSRHGAAARGQDDAAPADKAFLGHLFRASEASDPHFVVDVLAWILVRAISWLVRMHACSVFLTLV